MLRINESSAVNNNKRIERSASNCSSGGLKFDRAGLMDKLEEYRKLANEEVGCGCRVSMCSHKQKKINYGVISKYIEDLLSELNKYSKLKVKWQITNGRIKSTPFPLESSAWCNFDVVDYIYKIDEKTVVISYKQLWDAMAFQIAHRDMGYESKEMDQSLEACGICDVSSYDEHLSELVGNRAYNQAMKLKIDDCPFSSKNRDEIYDYFGDRQYCTSYKDLIDVSINKAMLILLDDTLKKVSTYRENAAEFLGVMDDKVYFNTGLENEAIYKLMCSPFTIKLFGREFEMAPYVNIY